ncbi:MAG TPA: hypothetical protein VG797_11295 [Phycisphaerales bacterium]|nr:hypothetical protein [Phycisphaerales bacterium]
MFERIRAAIISLLIAATIWLFAENQSLGESVVFGRIRFLAGDAMVHPNDPRDWDGNITIELRGSKVGIARARAVLDEPIELRAGMAGVPARDGVYPLDLATVLGSYEPLVRAGVTVAGVSPSKPQIVVREMIDQELPVAPKLEGIQVDGPVRITPDRVSVHMPAAIWREHQTTLKLDAAPSADDRKSLPERGPASVIASLTLPPELQGEEGAYLSTQTVTLSFNVRSTTAAYRVDLVPVWVVLPNVDVGRSDTAVQIAQSDQVLSADLTGPSDEIDRLRSSNDKLIALLSLNSDEIDAAITSKTIGFAVLRNGVMGALPESIRVTPSKSTVSFTIKRNNGTNGNGNGGAGGTP